MLIRVARYNYTVWHETRIFVLPHEAYLFDDDMKWCVTYLLFLMQKTKKNNKKCKSILLIDR